MVYSLQTSRTFSRCWEAYERSVGRHPDTLRRFRAILPYVPPAARVLDLGCATGTFGRMALDDSPRRQVTGYDFAPNMIQAAKHKVPEGQFECRDIRRLHCPGQSYDALILSFLIDHLAPADLQSLIPQCAKALSDNGLLYLSFADIKKPGFHQPDFADTPLHFSSHGPDAVLHLLQANGIAFLHLWTDFYCLGEFTSAKAYHFIGHNIN